MYFLYIKLKQYLIQYIVKNEKLSKKYIGKHRKKNNKCKTRLKKNNQTFILKLMRYVYEDYY